MVSESSGSADIAGEYHEYLNHTDALSIANIYTETLSSPVAAIVDEETRDISAALASVSFPDYSGTDDPLTLAYKECCRSVNFQNIRVFPDVVEDSQDITNASESVTRSGLEEVLKEIVEVTARKNLPIDETTEVSSEDEESDLTPPTTQKQPEKFGFITWIANINTSVKHLIAGGIAGGVSRTVVSPLERLKILFQVQGPEPSNYNGVVHTLRKIWRDEGFLGYMRGNGTNIIRIVPYSAAQFAAYEQFKKLLMEKGKSELDTPRRLASGALAGVTSVACTYPLDIVRTRLSVQSALALQEVEAEAIKAGKAGGKLNIPKLPGIWETMRSIYQVEGGVRALYRGLGPTLMGVAPYVALNFQAYEVLRKYFTPAGRDSPSGTRKLVCGALAGCIAQTITYPLDVLRRRMQVTGMANVNYKYRNTWHALNEVIQKETIRGLYKGMIPNYLKVAPAIGVSFWTYELCKDFMGAK